MVGTVQLLCPSFHDLDRIDCTLYTGMKCVGNVQQRCKTRECIKGVVDVRRMA